MGRGIGIMGSEWRMVINLDWFLEMGSVVLVF